MQWKLSDEQKAYREALEGWLRSSAGPEVRRAWFEAEDTAVFEDLFTSAGWAGVGLPESVGGQGGGTIELALTAESLGRAAAPSAAWLATILAAAVLGAGEPELASRCVAEQSAAVAVPAEQPIDSAPHVRADASERLSGQVSRVLGAQHASVLVVPALTDGELGVWVVETSAVDVAARRPLDRSRPLADLTFDAVPARRLAVDAATVLEQAASLGAVLVAADTVGAMQTMLDLAVEYSGQRQQFGVPIGSFQAVKHAAATMLVGVEAARSVVYLAAASIEAGAPDAALHAAAAKAQVTAEGVRAADAALTIHGAIGYTWEHDLHLFYKRAKLNRSLLGTPEHWNDRLADALLTSA